MATPEQCPECARFLAKDFVAGLADGDAPCPRCDTTLTASMFGIAGGDAAAAAVTSEAKAESAAGDAADRGRVDERRASDVLEGWDQPPPPPKRVVRPPSRPAPSPAAAQDRVIALPLEAAVVIGLASAAAGFVVARRHPVWGALLGGVSGLMIAAAGRDLYQHRGSS